MRLIGTLLLFAGYTLIYSAVANGGRFVTEPWAALLGDAYTDTSTSAATATAGGTPSPAAGVTGHTTPQPGRVIKGRTGTPFGGFRP